MTSGAPRSENSSAARPAGRFRHRFPSRTDSPDPCHRARAMVRQHRQSRSQSTLRRVGTSRSAGSCWTLSGRRAGRAAADRSRPLAQEVCPLLPTSRSLKSLTLQPAPSARFIIRIGTLLPSPGYPLVLPRSGNRASVRRHAGSRCLRSPGDRNGSTPCHCQEADVLGAPWVAKGMHRDIGEAPRQDLRRRRDEAHRYSLARICPVRDVYS